MTDHVTILGGAGKTGRRIAERLAARDVPFRLASRSTRPRFDWTDEATWAPALAGSRAVYVAYQPDLALDGAAAAVGRVAALAREAGVGRLVLLAGRGEPGAMRAEAALAAAGVPWTILRCAWFAQGFSEDFLRDDVLRGAVVMPAPPELREPFVDAGDIADAAVAALTEDGHAGALYELTGPAALTFPEAAQAIAAATGRDVAYVPVGLDEWLDGARAAGADDGLVDLLALLYRETLDGRNSAPQDGVRRILGRAPRTFAQVAADAAAAGAWTAHPAGR